MREHFELTPMQKDARNCLHHRGDIVLVDDILECYQDGIITQSIITSSNPFLKTKEQIFPMFQGIELIAQSLGCYQKILHSHKGLISKPRIGFLLSARNFEILMPFAKVGQKLITQVEITTQDESGFGVCEGKIFFDNMEEGQLACRSSVSVLCPNEGIQEFIRNKK